MQTIDIYHTQGIRGFKVATTHYIDGLCIVKIKASEHICPHCRSSEVTLYPVRERQVQVQKCGSQRLLIKVDVHRIYCIRCGVLSYEQLNFLPYPKAVSRVH